MFGEVTLAHLRGLPDGSLTKAEVNLLVDYIEKLEAKTLGHTRTATDQGPDYCEECSESARDWVKWPCAYMRHLDEGML